ncbi:putative Ablim, partial [Operophtera brumata]
KVVCGACGGKCSGEVLRVSDKYFHTACFTCRTCAASLAKGGFFCKDAHYYCPQVHDTPLTIQVHTACFTCRTCAASLAKGGFFCKDAHYYCLQVHETPLTIQVDTACFTRRTCAASLAKGGFCKDAHYYCPQYVEGEVVSALGNTYHQKCFTCARCKRAFPSGEKVTYTGAEVVCSGCVAGPQRQTARAAPSPLSAPLASPTPEPRLPSADVERPPGDPNGQALVALDR